MPVETLVLDLGRTLIPFSFAPLMERLHAREPEAWALFLPFESGQLAPDAFRRRMSELADMPLAGFDAWWNSIFEPRWLVPSAWLRRLRAQRRLGLVSNTNVIHWEFLRARFPELLEFDFRVLSFEAGAVKPDAAIYAAVEQEARCPPGAIFYADDIADYVAAARGRGWQAEVFTSAEAFAAALARADPALPALSPPPGSAPPPRA